MPNAGELRAAMLRLAERWKEKAQEMAWRNRSDPDALTYRRLAERLERAVKEAERNV